eukprot:scaffold4476_cov120-Skeletonema_dohrnii-CCMP3373.AAC.13
MASSGSPLHNFVTRSSSMGDSSSTNGNNGYTTKERANTSDSNNTGILSPSYSKEDDYGSIADDSQVDDDNDDEYNEDGDLMGSGMLILPPGESSSPSRVVGNNSKVVAGRKYDLCGSMYKRRGGFGRNKENNW